MTFLGDGMDSEYHLKKSALKTRYNKLPVDSVLLFEGDEKGPVAAKTCGGISWSSIQSKVSKAQQKIKGILNMFGIYDHTNN